MKVEVIRTGKTYLNAFIHMSYWPAPGHSLCHSSLVLFSVKSFLPLLDRRRSESAHGAYATCHSPSEYSST